jgi:hypothetical protein
MGLQYRSYDLGRQQRGSVAVVELRGNAANGGSWTHTTSTTSRTDDSTGTSAVGQALTCTACHSGNGHWYVTVDLIGLRGSVRSSVVVEPPPLPLLRSTASAPLSHIRHEAPPDLDINDGQQVWDVFVSHASEDKAAVARPLAEHLRERGLTVWLDDSELRIGDSLRRKIDAGLAGAASGWSSCLGPSSRRVGRSTSSTASSRVRSRANRASCRSGMTSRRTR